MTTLGSVTEMKNSTTLAKQNEEKTTGATEIGQDAFLQLLMAQMSNQDPLEPTSNEQFISQTAQFTQINELQKLNSAYSSSSEFMQASSLIGKTVTVTDPDNDTKTITGKVSEANFNGTDTSITMNGKTYPIDLIVGVKDSE